jgi:hypothetical protein
MKRRKGNTLTFKKNYKSSLKRIKERNKQMANEIEQENSRMPQCLATINKMLSDNERALNGPFAKAPDYFKTELKNIHDTLMAMFKNVSARMSGSTPEISVAKVIACADSLRGVDEHARGQLLALADTMAEDVKTLTPDVISKNLNSFRVIMDNSNVEANEEGIDFNADAQFVITIDGKEYLCELNGKFPVPSGILTLKKKQAL